MTNKLPPWSDKKSWVHVQRYFEHTFNNGDNFTHVSRHANCIASKLKQIDHLLETLCANSCDTCNDVCCIRATIWYDFRDLLFLFSHKGEIPDKQITRKNNLSCEYLSSNGCELLREERPFICTWYICAQQKEMLRKSQLNPQMNQVRSVLAEIQSERKKMEDCFIAVLK